MPSQKFAKKLKKNDKRKKKERKKERKRVKKIIFIRPIFGVMRHIRSQTKTDYCLKICQGVVASVCWVYVLVFAQSLVQQIKEVFALSSTPHPLTVTVSSS